jgi:glycosyltransferase involved in cell wall biosynthesis
LAPQIADRASAVITVSNYSKQDIIKYLNVKPDKISVTYEGIDSKFKIGDYENINSKFILAFGGHEIRKNCLRIIDAFSVFSQKNTDINLVLCGVKDDYKKHIDSYINMQNIRDRVTLLPYISDEDLVKLYNQAEMLLYPSLYEGFGFPILESMACGTPVIASNTTSIPEISGNCALLIDPLNTEEIANSLLQLSEDTELRQQLIQQGKQRSAKFSWHNTAEETKKLYESIRRTQHSSK